VTSLRGLRVYLDTNVFHYALNGFPAYASSLTELFDAIHASTARLARCDVFLTNDTRLKTLAGFVVRLLSDQ
jgi:predicted nucleic acid-binding protein